MAKKRGRPRNTGDGRTKATSITLPVQIRELLDKVAKQKHTNVSSIIVGLLADNQLSLEMKLQQYRLAQGRVTRSALLEALRSEITPQVAIDIEGQSERFFDLPISTWNTEMGKAIEDYRRTHTGERAVQNEFSKWFAIVMTAVRQAMTQTIED